MARSCVTVAVAPSAKNTCNDTAQTPVSVIVAVNVGAVFVTLIEVPPPLETVQTYDVAAADHEATAVACISSGGSPDASESIRMSHSGTAEAGRS